MSAILTLHNPVRGMEYYRRGWWQHDTFYSILARNAAQRPGRYAVRDSARRLTWNALKAWVDRVALDLEQAGLRSGDRVCVWLPNRVETVVLILACSRNGYICNPSLHQTYTVADVVKLAGRLQAAAFFGQAGFGADAKEHDVFAAVQAMPSMRRVVRFAAAAEAGVPALDGPLDGLREPAPCPDKIVLLAFTSGTTGDPKGVMHSDNTLLAQARAMAKDWRHHEALVLYSMSPLTHAIGTIAMAQGLVSGFEVVLNDLPAGRVALDWVIETGATYVMGVPTHAIDLLQEVDRRGATRLGAVSVFYMAGAPIPTEIARRLLSLGRVYWCEPFSVMPYTFCGRTPRLRNRSATSRGIGEPAM